MQINTLFTRALACQLGASLLVAAPLASAQTSGDITPGNQTPEELIQETVQDLTAGAESAVGSTQEEAGSVLDALEAELDELEAEVARQEGNAPMIDATGNGSNGGTLGDNLDGGATEASASRVLQDGSNAAGAPQSEFYFDEGEGPQSGDNTGESYFFEEDGARSFWRSDGRHIVHPITAPNYNGDAYITSDVRGHYLNHQFPSTNAGNGGAARVYGFQFRKALTESLQVQISKLGFNDVHLGGSEEAGLDDLGLAIKYAFLQDWQSQTHASVGVGYEIGIGDEETFGDDAELRLFGAFNKGFDRSHIGFTVNALFATGTENINGDSDRLSAHFHYDYEWNETFSPIVELNYYSTLSNGNPVTPFSGLDLANVGGNEDEDALSYGIGGELRLQRDLAVRLAYEGPLTDNVDLWGYRWTASAVWRF